MNIENIVGKLRKNEILILPTDTIYGLTSIVSEENKIKINKLKNRPEDQEIIILVSSLKMARKWIHTDEESSELLVSNEPTTVIGVSQKGDPFQAVRVVRDKNLISIIEKTGALYSTSANIHGSPYIDDLEIFKTIVNEDDVYYTKKLKGEPSRIFNSLLGTFLR
ncbi:tRNA threonylcarbamoyladenosine biosynthesis protein TsaC [Spiroplasma sp. TIUS-1]|uniref:Sua5/YciO/YrdC/YwlC family protein n=1 Tax=Spiroplasma sp. TIUS-1 TaxID=216963 RepID=UPI0013986D7D|nr:Sua5/YciO/YrdC/YwlC family protein [Spiroplasma sp. TIUS-1]QHX36206.1 tRNA threonylcarbamoyladenosine biosynthesis protein TsaC [Spiroplasma sp. TIUS-1]